MDSSILERLHHTLFWPEPDRIFNPPGAGPAVYSRLAKLKIQLPLENSLGKDQVQVGVLVGNPDSDESDAPIAIVCEFVRPITEKELNDTRNLAWNFCRSPLLITIEPQLIRAWSCYEKPDSEGQFPPTPITSEGDGPTFNLDNLVDTLHWIKLASGQYFYINQKYFDRDQRADATLLKNLQYVREKLTFDLPIDIAHDLLARIVFVQFLFHRKDTKGNTALNEKKLISLYEEEILSNKYKDLSSILRHKSDTFGLFKWLNEKFNGDLFPKSYSSEEKCVKASHLSLLADFVSGKLRMGNGQYVLWPYYSFDTIPLEFISSIYEEFVTNRDDDIDEETGIGEHYTRPFLVDFILDKVLPWNGTSYNLKILDPCCGSAVFLVKAFQRLVQRWRNANPGAEPQASFLRKLLEDNLFGVDTNKNAIHVASFSLYLAMCDEIDPKHYWSQVHFPSLRENRIRHTDFFSEDVAEIKTLLSDDKKYNLVIGNAPWGQDSLTDKAKKWASHNNWEPVDEQSGTLFLAKAAKLCKSDGYICMIQPAGALLFNISPTALRFRKKLFNNYKVDEIVNLSALRFLKIFPNAIGPACIIKFRPIEPDDNPIAYWSPKSIHSKEEYQRIVIDVQDLNWVWPEEAATEAVVWPALTWGSRRDLSLILKLKNNNETIESSNHVNTSRGFTRGKDGEVYNERIGLPILEGKEGKKIWKNLPIYSGTTNFPRNDNPCFVRVRNDDVFKLPTIVMKETWTIQANNKFKAVLVRPNKKGKDILLFSNTFMGIKSDNADLLASLHIVLNSSFAVYYLFLSSGRLASYVPAIRDEDLKSLPLPVKKVNVKELQTLDENNIDECVFDVYDLTSVECALVEDFFEISIHDYKDAAIPIGRNPVPPSEVMEIYCEWFLNVLKSGFGSNKHISATIFKPTHEDEPTYNVIAIHLDWPRKKEIQYEYLENSKLFEKLNDLEETLKKQSINKTIFYSRVSRIYQSMQVTENGKTQNVPTVFLIKPNQIRYWTRSVALRDADEVAFDIMQWATLDNEKKETTLNVQG